MARRAASSGARALRTRGPRSKRLDLLDAISDPQELVKRLPHYAPRFDALANLRTGIEDLATLTSHGRALAGTGGAKRVASVPWPVLAAALALEPDLMHNRRKFYAWLDRNPAYQVYRRRRPMQHRGFTKRDQ